MDIGLIAGQALLAIDILNGDDTPDLEIGRCRCGLGSCDQGLDRAVRQGLISERPDTSTSSLGLVNEPNANQRQTYATR